MKIGIITWFGGPNYGTNLQAIALQRYLRNCGYHVEIINFSPPEPAQKIKKTFWQRVANQPQKYADKYSNKKYKEEITQKLYKIESEVNKNCVFTENVKDESDYIRICNEFDILIFGSDQIWNPNWYHKYYYADYPEIKAKKVSYAPSLGVLCINKDQEINIRGSLQSFSSVSVRENQGADIIENITGSRPQVVMDPTFLLDAQQWEDVLEIPQSPNEGYVLSMFLTDNSHHWRAAEKFAKCHHLKHIILPYTGFSYMQRGEIKPDIGLRELLSLIKGAQFILTDSFHITVFSIIFGREFYTFMRFKDDGFTSQNTRVINLLELSGLQERMLPYSSCTISEKHNINYDEVTNKLSNEISKSKQYLNEAIER